MNFQKSAIIDPDESEAQSTESNESIPEVSNNENEATNNEIELSSIKKSQTMKNMDKIISKGLDYTAAYKKEEFECNDKKS